MLQIPDIFILDHIINYAKVYPRKTKIIVYKQPKKVLSSGWELSNPKLSNPKSQSINPTCYIDSIRRTKTIISDIVLSNDFELFITFTFKKDRQNINKLKTQITNWIHNQKRIHGDFQYILVPEFHKDGKSIHFHGLFKNYKGNLTLASRQINNRLTHNIKSYTLGFSTAVEIDDYEKVSSYIKKYITKDMPQLKNKKRYWTSQGLIRPQIINNIDLSTIDHTNLQQTFSNDLLTIYETNSIIQIQQLNEV